ncbi:hypothetical protein WMZ97_11485 [Lentibacillus sp. N15]|uniref:hypothetical protein n=1 Tax=Lentibacillus songyuanensis TaxID=3136161 RepID=UPI0031BA5330
MREITLQELDQAINKNRKKANEIIQKTLPRTGRRKKSRTRISGEREALNEISIARWNKALQTGKIKYISDRVWCYDYNE